MSNNNILHPRKIKINETKIDDSQIIDSQIIDSNIALTVSKWVDKVDINYKYYGELYLPYNLNHF